MPQVDWTAYWNLVFARFRGFFTDEGQRVWMNEAAAQARADVHAAGGAVEAEDAAAREASNRVCEALRAATGHPMKRSHAQMRDVYLVQDLLISEPVFVNKALVVDAAIAVAESVAFRPGMLANDYWDMKNETSFWHAVAPLTMADVVIDSYGIDVVIGGGYHSTLHIDVCAQRAKGQYLQMVEYSTALTANSVKMIRCAPVRLMRLQLSLQK